MSYTNARAWTSSVSEMDYPGSENDSSGNAVAQNDRIDNNTKRSNPI